MQRFHDVTTMILMLLLMIYNEVFPFGLVNSFTNEDSI